MMQLGFQSPLTLLITVVLSLCVAMLFARFGRGPTSYDRLVAFEGFALVLLCIAAFWSLLLGTAWFFDAILVLSLVGFLSTIAVALYLEDRGES